MRKHARAVLTILTATILLAIGTNGAAAQRFSLTENNIRTVFDPLAIISEAGNISCRVTLEGSFHSRSLLKTQELFGFITRVLSDLANCVDSFEFFNPNISVLAETLPWHISNLGWTGTLPRIAGLFLLLEEVGVELLGFPFTDCDYIENLDFIATPEAGGGWRLEPDAADIVVSPGGSCPEFSFTSNNPPITRLGTITAIRVTLI